jgi:hypothetical protein
MLATLVLLAGFWAWTFGLSGPFQFDDGVTPLGDPASASLAAWQQHPQKDKKSKAALLLMAGSRLALSVVCPAVKRAGCLKQQKTWTFPRGAFILPALRVRPKVRMFCFPSAEPFTETRQRQ